MKLFGIRDMKEGMYFQIEKTKEGLHTIDRISHELFRAENEVFESRWQLGLPEKEDFEQHEESGIFMGVVVTKERVHIVIRGLKDKRKCAKIKNFILDKYQLVKPESII